MEKKRVNNFIFVIGFVVIVGLISTYLILNHNPETEHLSTTNSSLNTANNSVEKYVDFTENVKERAKEINFTALKHNTKPQFKVGDKFKYIERGSWITPKKNFTDIGINDILECNVEKLERINGRDCYLLNTKTVSNYQDDSSLKEIITETKHWVDKDTGKIIKAGLKKTLIQKNGKMIEMPNSEATIPDETSEIYGNFIYYPWMLALDDNFEMKINENMRYGGKTYVKVFKVVGREKVNGRDCFKVEMRELDNNRRVVLRKNMWVDIKKRILVKEESYLENLKVGGIYLIDYSGV